MAFLTAEQKKFYDENGYLVLERYLSKQIIADAQKEITRLSEHATKIDASDDLVDVENTHNRNDPRIRRIKRPDLQSEFFNNLMRSDNILGPARDLIGDDIRMHTTKLNMKAANYGAAIEWHQDFAFYPHTNDDALAMGIVFDDMGSENGPLMVVPGSHKGPIYDHHDNGVFVGAVDLKQNNISLDDAVELNGPAGTVSIHHARILHGSALNTSDRDRRMLFYEMIAADAFPIMGAMTTFEKIEEYDQLMLCGEPTLQPRMKDIPIRVPQPQPEKNKSIYEVQSGLKNRTYETIS